MSTVSEGQQKMLSEVAALFATTADVSAYRVMLRMYEKGLISEDNLIDYYMDIGYKENDAEIMLSLQMMDSGKKKPKRKRKPNRVREFITYSDWRHIAHMVLLSLMLCVACAASVVFYIEAISWHFDTAFWALFLFLGLIALMKHNAKSL